MTNYKWVKSDIFAVFSFLFLFVIFFVLLFFGFVELNGLLAAAKSLKSIHSLKTNQQEEKKNAAEKGKQNSGEKTKSIKMCIESISSVCKYFPLQNLNSIQNRLESLGTLRIKCVCAIHIALHPIFEMICSISGIRFWVSKWKRLNRKVFKKVKPDYSISLLIHTQHTFRYALTYTERYNIIVTKRSAFGMLMDDRRSASAVTNFHKKTTTKNLNK